MNDPYVEETISSISESAGETYKFSNQNGGNFIIGKPEHKILPIFSRKYTLDQGTSKQSLFEDNSLAEGASEINNASPIKGILKNQISEPAIVHSSFESPKIERRTQSDTNFGSRIKYRIHFPNFRPRPRSSQEFENPAFEPDETLPKDFKLRDLVARALKQQNNNDEFLHPYGRSNLYTTVFMGDKTSNVQTDGSKLAFWVILLLVLLGITGGIIFMAEMHQHENSATNNSTLTGL